MWYRYPGTLALRTLLTTSQRDTLAWQVPRQAMPTRQRSLRYPQLPHIATLRAGRQVEGWVYHCVCCQPLQTFPCQSVCSPVTCVGSAQAFLHIVVMFQWYNLPHCLIVNKLQLIINYGNIFTLKKTVINIYTYMYWTRLKHVDTV